MNKYLKKIIAFVLAFVLLISCYVPSFALSSSEIEKLDGNWGKRDVVCTTLSSDAVSYYSQNGISYDALFDDGASAIKSTLSTLMKSTHVYTSSYDDCHYAAHKTDCEEDNGKITLIYTSYQATQSQWNGWNREHVWPKSLGGNNTSGGGADLHHIRPSDAGVNSSRGNKKYGNVSGGTEKYGSNPATGYLGGTYSSSYFEPNDNVKGDVARICLYVWVRWGSSWGADSVTEVFQSVDVLLEWCEMDPVDTWEMGRNDVIEDIQGNRNVFIDYPELAWLLFDREIPTDMVTPSGEAADGAGSGSGGGNTHTHNYTSAITKQPTCTVVGVKTFTCSCGDSYTQPISATGHSYTSAVTKQPTCTLVGEKTFTCSCGDSYTQSIAKLSHDYVDGVCSSCGLIEGEEYVCKHDLTQLRGASSPTCQKEGYTGSLYCVTCGELLEEGKAIPVSNEHDFGEWEIDSTGREYKVCAVCGKIRDIDIEGLLTDIENDAELILLLISLGLVDKMLVDELS